MRSVAPRPSGEGQTGHGQRRVAGGPGFQRPDARREVADLEAAVRAGHALERGLVRGSLEELHPHAPHAVAAFVAPQRDPRSGDGLLGRVHDAAEADPAAPQHDAEIGGRAAGHERRHLFGTRSESGAGETQLVRHPGRQGADAEATGGGGTGRTAAAHHRSIEAVSRLRRGADLHPGHRCPLLVHHHTGNGEGGRQRQGRPLAGACRAGRLSGLQEEPGRRGLEPGPLAVRRQVDPVGAVHAGAPERAGIGPPDEGAGHGLAVRDGDDPAGEHLQGRKGHGPRPGLTLLERLDRDLQPSSVLRQDQHGLPRIARDRHVEKPVRRGPAGAPPGAVCEEADAHPGAGRGLLAGGIHHPHLPDRTGNQPEGDGAATGVLLGVDAAVDAGQHRHPLPPAAGKDGDAAGVGPGGAHRRLPGGEEGVAGREPRGLDGPHPRAGDGSAVRAGDAHLQAGVLLQLHCRQLGILN